MELVVDANVLFSAAIKDSKTTELILRDDLELYAPDFLFDEFEKYRELLLERTYREPHEFRRFVRILEGRITVCSKETFAGQLPDAGSASPDPKDVPYVALAMALPARIWSDDSALRSLDAVDVLTTAELTRTLERPGVDE